jgi:hypothetical protein
LGSIAKTYFLGKGDGLDARTEVADRSPAAGVFGTGLNAGFHLATLLQASGPVFAGNLAKRLILWAILLDCVRHGQ